MDIQKIYEKVVNRTFSNKYEWFKKIVFSKVSMTKVQGQSYLSLDGIIYVDKNWAFKMWEEYGFIGRPFPVDVTLGEIIGGNVTKEISEDLREIYSGVAGVLTPIYTTLSWLYIVLVDDKEETMTENTNTRSTIKRVLKEVMGIINEGIPSKVIRRLNDLDKYIKSSYTWLNPKAFENFEEFFERVVFSTTRDFVGDVLLDDNFTYEEIVKIREEVEVYINKIIVDNYLLELEAYYFGHTQI
jgi:hypothetical protein